MYNKQVHLPSDIEAIGKFMNDTMLEIERILPNEDLLFDIKLIIDELVVNGAKHGNKWDKSKKVSVTISITEDDLTICVEDEGSGIDRSLVAYCPDKMECDGRGLFIVEALTDRIEYEKNRISCVKILS